MLNASGCEPYRADYSSLDLTEDDLELVARAVRAETEGENFLIKTCVTSMIFNRLTDPILGCGVEEAVYDGGAFLRADRASIDKEVSDAEIEEYIILAKTVRHYGIDPTCGALFCFRENDCDADYFTVTLEVDGLRFAAP